MARAKTIVALVLALLLLPVSLLLCAFALPTQYNETFLGELKYKNALLAAAPAPKLVVVGGSSVAFGLDSALLAEQLPAYTPVNYGMYAALGTTVMLDLCAPDLQAGDVVIVSPEQQQQTLSAYFGAPSVWQALDGAFDLLPRINHANYPALLAALPEFAGAKLGYLLKGTPPAVSGLYTRAAFDKNGEIAADCQTNQMPQGFDANTPIYFDPAYPDAAFLAYFNAWADAQTAKGVTVYYHFSPMNAAAVTDESALDAYYQTLAAALHCEILGDPHQSIYDPAWFYDTNFHLNTAGRTANTRLWVRELKAVWGDSTPTTIPLPAAPGPQQAPAEAEALNNADAAYFTAADGLVTGLTEAGRTQTALLVPGEIDGKAIRGIAAGAFAHGTALQTLTLQPNIATIGDGAFAGCTALQTITLQSGNPADCVVGQQLLQGCTATVEVPAAALAAYKLNYFWSQYAARLTAR